MKKRLHGAGSQLGITLIELLISLSLGLLLMTGMSTLYLTSSLSYRQQQALTRLQENARQALALLGQDIRMAGNLGCGTAQRQDIHPLNLINQGAAHWWSDAHRPLFGIDENLDDDALGDAQFPSSAPGAYATTTIRGDTLMVLRANTDDAPAWVDSHDFGTAPIAFTGAENGFATGQLLFFSDCQQQRVLFQKTGPSSGPETAPIEHTKGNYASPQRPGNCKADLQGNSCDTPPASSESPRPARLWAWSAHAYYLRYSPRHYAHSSAAIPSLYRQVLGSSNNGISSTAEDLINGVVDMQFLYGMDTEPTEAGDGIIDAYLTASEINGSAGKDWQRVKSVQVTLTLESEDDGLLSSAQTWIYANGHRVTDHRLRHRYTQTFAIRNRL